jgi:hypothetical protein
VRLHSTRITKRRALVLASLTALLAAALFGTQLGTSAAAPQPKVDTVFIRGEVGGGNFRLFFDAPKTVHNGDILKVRNTTNPRQVGPHTFSMVKSGLLPDTKPERKQCSRPGHICAAIAKWHGVKGNGPVTQNPAKAGKAGWDTEGSLTKKGDSWFTGNKKATSISQVVSAKAGTTMTFMCVIHPWMHADIRVLP